jgi:hypothetical protein
MKKLTLLLLLIVNSAHSQNYWHYGVGSAPNNGMKIYHMAPVKDGNGIILYGASDKRLLQRIDSNGVRLWTKILDIPGEHRGNITPTKSYYRYLAITEIVPLFNGDFVLTAMYDSTWETNGPPIEGNVLLTSVISKYDNNGNHLWSKSIDSVTNYGHSGGYRVLRYEKLIENYSGDLIYYGNHKFAKFDQNGNYQGSFRIPDSLTNTSGNFHSINSLIVNSIGKIYLTGVNPSGIFVSKFDETGGILEGKQIYNPTSYDLISPNLTYVSDNDFRITTEFKTNSNRLLSLLIKTDSLINFNSSKAYRFHKFEKRENHYVDAAGNDVLIMAHQRLGTTGVDTMYRVVCTIAPSGAIQKSLTLPHDTTYPNHKRFWGGTPIYSSSEFYTYYYGTEVNNPPFYNYSANIYKFSIDSFPCKNSHLTNITDSTVTITESPISLPLISFTDSTVDLPFSTHDTLIDLTHICGSVIGVDELENEISISVFPNPVINSFSINAITSEKINEIIIYDALGKRIKELKQENDSNRKYDISFFPSGTYFLKFQFDNQSRTIPILKQ